MDKIILRIQLLNNSSKIPKYATEGSAGLDLTAAIDSNILIKKNTFKLIPTGIAIEIPKNHEAQIRPRSGLAIKSGITVLNSPGTIDEDYRGEISVILFNAGTENFIVEPAMRIAQMVVSPISKVEVEEVISLNSTKRNKDGFGSTGIK